MTALSCRAALWSAGWGLGWFWLFKNPMKTFTRFAPAVLGLLAFTVSSVAQTYHVTDLGALNGAPTYATSISDNGVISGYSQPDANSARAWIWRTGVGLTDAGSFGGADNRASFVGVDGRLYGYSQDAGGVPRGFVFDPVALTLGAPTSMALASVGVDARGS